MGSWLIRLAAMTSIMVMMSVLVLSCSRAPGSTTPEEFYRGRTVTWIVSGGPTSGTAAIARTIAPYLAKDLGATVKVEDAGTDEGVNTVYTSGTRDGLTLLLDTADAIISNDILKAPGVLYETEKFNFIADVSPTGKVLEISPKLPTRTLGALRQTKGLKAGGTTAKGSLALGAAVMFEILGLDGKLITGYKSKPELTLALARGEVDFMVTSDKTALKDENDGNLVNLLTVSSVRSRVVPNVPTIFELGVKVPKELEAAHNFVATSGISAALPPEVPQERIEYLRKVFMKLSDSQDLQKDALKVLDVWSPFLPGKEVQEKITVIKANKELGSQLDTLFAKYKAFQ